MLDQNHLQDNLMDNLKDAQGYMRGQRIDGWLLYDFQHSNPVFASLLATPRHLTRRVFLLVPAEGTPSLLTHHVDSKRLSDLTERGFATEVYLGQADLLSGLKKMLTGQRVVAMEYSPECALPVVSRVDAGTIELVRSFGPSVVSSADLLQYATSRWSDAQLTGHRQAAGLLIETLQSTWRLIGDNLGRITEFEAVSEMRRRFDELGLVTDEGPVVAVGPHSGDPHYEPPKEGSAAITHGDWVLIDFWAKLKEPGSVYADMTWVGYCGDSLPKSYALIFEIVRGARDRALELLASPSLGKGRLRGFEIDRVARSYIEETGYGAFFTHRLGHSIGQAIHSNGVNLDSFETNDPRALISGVGFSVEPGIYLPEFGVRSEVNVHIGPSGAEVTTPIQREVVLIG